MTATSGSGQDADGPHPSPDQSPGPVGGVLVFLLFAAASALVGAATGVAAVAVHRSGPAWLSLAVAASLAVAWVLRSTGTPRLGAAYCLGWLAVLGLAIAGRPEGDHVLAGDPAGYVMMAAGFVLVVLGVTSLGRGEDPPGT